MHAIYYFNYNDYSLHIFNINDEWICDIYPSLEAVVWNHDIRSDKRIAVLSDICYDCRFQMSWIQNFDFSEYSSVMPKEEYIKAEEYLVLKEENNYEN